MSDPASLVSNAAVRGAYRTSQSLTGQKAQGVEAEVSAEDFTAMVRNATQASLETVRSGEATAEAALRGQPWGEAAFVAAGKALEADFTPLSDWRASAEYRATAARNLLQRFFLTHDETTTEAVDLLSA